MEKRPSDQKSGISLDKVLSELAELESGHHEPEKLWSMGDIDALLDSTDVRPEPAAEEDDAYLLENIDYYTNQYSSDPEPELPKKPEPRPEATEPEPLETPTPEPVKETKPEPEPEPEPELEPEPEPELEPEQAVKAEAEAASETEPDAEAVVKLEEGTASEETDTEPEDEAEIGLDTEPAPEKHGEPTFKFELHESPKSASVPNFEFASNSDVKDGQDEDEPETSETPGEAEEDIATVFSVIHSEDSAAESENEVDSDASPEQSGEEPAEEKKPTVEDLFGVPVTRYFGDNEPDSKAANEDGAMPGLFDDTAIFTPASTKAESKNDIDEYKTKLISAIRSAGTEPGSEPIEKPGVILKRGAPSETSGLEPLPKVIPAEEFAGREDQTIQIDNQPFTDPNTKAQPEEDEQLVFSGFGEEPEPEKIDEEKLRSELDKKRAEKKKKFVLIHNIDDADAEGGAAQSADEPAGEQPDEPEQDKKKETKPLEYEKPSQRRRIYSALRAAESQFKTSFIGLCVLESVSLLLLLVPKIFEWAAIDSPAFANGGAGLAAANIVLILASVYLALPSVAYGFKELFRGRVTGDCVGGFAAILALLQAILSFFNKLPEGAAGTFYGSAAVFALLLLTDSRRREAVRTLNNFEFCTARRPSGLYCIKAIENEKDAFEVGRSLKMGNPDILYSGRIAFPSEFIANSRAHSLADGCVKRNLIVSAAASAVLAVIAGIVTRDVFQAIGVLTGAFCLTAPCAVNLALAIPLYMEDKELNSEGGMIAGYDAAFECSEAVAAAVDSADLFDRAACEMHGMKDFHTVRIDDVLLYAVAMVLKSGGPLTDVFNRIIGGSTDLLPPVRDLIYEDRLGLSATIYNQRVLLGNRNLLTHHNIDVPLKSDEDKVKRDGRKVLYIAIDSQIAAMFVLNYVEDSSLKESINELADNGFSLIVRTDDPNVTDELIAARFGIAQKDVKITLSHGSRIFSAYRDSVTDSSPARVLHDGSARSYFKSIAACGRLANFASRWAVFTLVIQAILAAGAVVCVALKVFAFVSPLTAVIVQGLTVALSVLIERFKR